MNPLSNSVCLTFTVMQRDLSFFLTFYAKINSNKTSWTQLAATGDTVHDISRHSINCKFSMWDLGRTLQDNVVAHNRLINKMATASPEPDTKGFCPITELVFK